MVARSERRAVRVLGGATKRGHFPEIFLKSKLLWPVDIHSCCMKFKIVDGFAGFGKEVHTQQYLFGSRKCMEHS
jgi:hypothetical protein